MRLKDNLPSPAMAVAVAALVVAFAGTAGADRGPTATTSAKSTFLRVVGEQKSGGSGELLKAEAKCPGGYNVFAGGYGTGTEISSVWFNARNRKNNSWETDLYLPPAGPYAPKQEGVTITAVAYCVKTGQPLVMGPKD
jgi:hypothetical protein